MKRAAMVTVLAILTGLAAGCGVRPGATENDPESSLDLPVIQAQPGSGSQVQQEDAAILAWGSFGGVSGAEIYESGGSLRIVDFVRFSDGIYEVVYDILTTDVGVVSLLATGIGFDLESGDNALYIVSASQVFDRTLFTVRIVAVTNWINPLDDVTLMEGDALFSLVVIGRPLD